MCSAMPCATSSIRGSFTRRTGTNRRPRFPFPQCLGSNLSRMAEPLLRVRELRTYFYTEGGVARAVDGVSFDIGSGETVGLVGESGCGKSVTAMSILRLIQPPGRVEAGSEITFEGKDIVAMKDKDLRDIRGARIAMVFQEPMTALNPVFTVGDQIAEV